MTPIDNLQRKYVSAEAHLQAIENAIMEQFAITDWKQIRKAVRAAFDVGHRTTTSDDWCDS